MLTINKYYPSRNSDYAGIPLIEVFPPMTLERLEAIMTCGIHYVSAERSHAPEERMQYVFRLCEYYLPLDSHVNFAFRVWTLICSGYRLRDPRRLAINESFGRLLEAINEDRVVPSTFAEFLDSPWVAVCIGTPGCGKSSCMNSFLWRLGRQLLYHARHDIYQLLFVRIQAPKDGSMLALCERLYEELRKAATCTRLPMPYGFRSPRTVNEYVAAIELFATKLNVGLIVIEELQHMYLNQMHADQGAMRLLTNVISTMHIPILFIGTWPAASLLSVEVRLGRRATGPVVAFFRRMQNDEEFEAFLTALFHFQFTTGVTAIDAGLVQAFHKHTQGIADLVVKLFAICQLELISMDEGVFDVALVERLGEQEMVLICPAVRALREGRNENDSKLWDLEPVDLHDYLKAYADRVTLQTAISSRRGARGLRRRIETHVTATAVANALLAASEIPPEAAAAIATSQVERNPDDSTTESVRKILNRVSEGARGPRPTRSRDQRKQDRTDEAFATLDDDDARKVVYLAARDKRNVPDALAEKGYVCGLLDDVPL